MPKTIGDCEICHACMFAGDYPPTKGPRLKGVCWDCMKAIDSHPARGKSLHYGKALDGFIVESIERAIAAAPAGKEWGRAASKASEAMFDGDIDELKRIASKAMRRACAGWQRKLERILGDLDYYDRQRRGLA